MGAHSRLTLLSRLGAGTLVCATVVIGGAHSSYASVESSYLSILNQERTSHGLAPLQANAELTAVANSWATRMASSGVLRHNPALTSEVHNWQALGENVGCGPDVRDLTDAFWASSEHRDNILDPDYTEVGIGATIADHRIYIAVEFRQPMKHVASTPSHFVPARLTEHASAVHVATHHALGPVVARVQRLLGLSVSAFFGAGRTT
jgi:uncharacterized protein YkwD